MSSGTRAISLESRVREALSVLKKHRAVLADLLNEADETIADVEHICDAIAALELTAAGAADGHERAHVLSLGEAGEVVARVSESYGVPLRRLLGPGAASSVPTRKARRALAKALRDAGHSYSDIGKALRLSAETARKLTLTA